MAYSTLDQVYLLGLAAQAFTVRPRSPFADNAIANAVDASTATVRLKSHGLSALDSVSFEVTGGGTLPTGVSAFAVYTPIIVSSDLIQISGFASWASVGSGWGITVDPSRRILAHLEETAAEIDECLTADTPPILPDPITGLFPWQLVGMNARMAARAAVLSLQIENAAYRVAVDRLFAKEAEDKEQREIWRKGKPLNPRPIDQTDIPDNAAIAAGGTPTGWRSGTL